MLMNLQIGGRAGSPGKGHDLSPKTKIDDERKLQTGSRRLAVLEIRDGGLRRLRGSRARAPFSLSLIRHCCRHHPAYQIREIASFRRYNIISRSPHSKSTGPGPIPLDRSGRSRTSDFEVRDAREASAFKSEKYRMTSVRTAESEGL